MLYLFVRWVFYASCCLFIQFTFFFTKKTVQTGVALGQELEDKMPVNEYYEYFGPDYTLHVAPSNMENKNTRHQLDDIRSKLLDNLSKLRHAPSVQFQERLPDTELPEVRNWTSFVVSSKLVVWCYFIWKRIWEKDRDIWSQKEYDERTDTVWDAFLHGYSDLN